MKSRTSFFDKTVLRKDLSRFAPLWALYLIGGLLISISVAASSGSGNYMAQNLNSLIGPFGIISLCYGVLVAQLLFGDLFNTRLCNALHAMPLRREGWFLTHFTAGMLYSLVPNLLISLALMPFLGKFWYTALIWYFGMELHYLFFFGLAVFCMMLTGNRFAAAAVYAIINGLSAIALWFCDTIFAPMLYGVVIQNAFFARFCPVWGLCTHDDFFEIAHSKDCACLTNVGYDGPYFDSRCDYYFDSFGESWGYLIVLAVLGIALAVVALTLYRKRHLESAGDFMAFKGGKPVFTVVYTLCVGALLQIIGNLFDDPVYIFLLIGLIVGYFTSQMLLNRTLRVFKWKHWLCAALILVLVFGSVGLCRLDAFGMVRWTPDADEVVSVKVANSRVTEFRPSNTDAEITNREGIEKIIDIHRQLYAEGPLESRDDYDGLQNVTICYTLKDGRQVYRYYRATADGDAAWAINKFIFSNPTHILKADSLETLISKAEYALVEGMKFTGKPLIRLLNALWADGQAGTLHTGGKWDGEYMGYVQICYSDGRSVYLDIFDTNKHTTDWIKKEMMQTIDPSDLLNNVSHILIDGATLDWSYQTAYEEFCYIFAEEQRMGLIPEGFMTTGYQVQIVFYSGMTAEYTVTEKAEKCFGWIQKNIPNIMISGQ